MSSLRKIDNERAFASRLRESREALCSFLGFEPKTGPGQGGAETLEEATDAARAKELADDACGSCVSELKSLRAAYDAAVNAFWLYAEREGITDRIARAWAAANRRRLADSTYQTDDVSADATLAMRAQCIAYAVKESGSGDLLTYAKRGIFRELDAIVGGELSATTGRGYHKAKQVQGNDRTNVDPDLAEVPQ